MRAQGGGNGETRMCAVSPRRLWFSPILVMIADFSIHAVSDAFIGKVRDRRPGPKIRSSLIVPHYRRRFSVIG
jgi:hypothetical protein